MTKFRVIRKTVNYAIKREKEKCWRQAIIAYTRCIVMCADKVQKLTSKRAQQKLMGWTYKCMEKCAYIENYVLFLEQKERYEQSKLQTQNVPFNINKIMEDYFQSPKGLRHTQEQKKSLTDIAKLLDISRPKITFANVFGCEGN